MDNSLFIALTVIGLLILPCIVHKIISKCASQQYLNYRSKCKDYKLTSTVGDIIYELIRQNNLRLFVEPVKGILADCFDGNTLYLSSMDSRSPISLGIALHEYGHALSNRDNQSFEEFASIGRYKKLTRFLVCAFIVMFVLQHCIQTEPWHLMFFMLMIISIGAFIIFKVAVLISEINATKVALNLLPNYVDNNKVINISKKTLGIAFSTYVAEIFADFGNSVLFFFARL